MQYEQTWRQYESQMDAKKEEINQRKQQLLSKKSSQSTGVTPPTSTVVQTQSTYTQPAVSYSQPSVSYPQPALSYSQSAMSYSQPAMSYHQPMVSYPQPSGFGQPHAYGSENQTAQLQYPPPSSFDKHQPYNSATAENFDVAQNSNITSEGASTDVEGGPDDWNNSGHDNAAVSSDMGHFNAASAYPHQPMIPPWSGNVRMPRLPGVRPPMNSHEAGGPGMRPRFGGPGVQLADASRGPLMQQPGFDGSARPRFGIAPEFTGPPNMRPGVDANPPRFPPRLEGSAIGLRPRLPASDNSGLRPRLPASDNSGPRPRLPVSDNSGPRFTKEGNAGPQFPEGNVRPLFPEGGVRPLFSNGAQARMRPPEGGVRPLFPQNSVQPLFQQTDEEQEFQEDAEDSGLNEDMLCVPREPEFRFNTPSKFEDNTRPRFENFAHDTLRPRFPIGNDMRSRFNVPGAPDMRPRFNSPLGPRPGMNIGGDMKQNLDVTGNDNDFINFDEPLNKQARFDNPNQNQFIHRGLGDVMGPRNASGVLGPRGAIGVLRPRGPNDGMGPRGPSDIMGPRAGSDVIGPGGLPMRFPQYRPRFNQPTPSLHESEKMGGIPKVENKLSVENPETGQVGETDQSFENDDPEYSQNFEEDSTQFEHEPYARSQVMGIRGPAPPRFTPPIPRGPLGGPGLRPRLAGPRAFTPRGQFEDPMPGPAFRGQAPVHGRFNPPIRAPGSGIRPLLPGLRPPNSRQGPDNTYFDETQLQGERFAEEEEWNDREEGTGGEFRETFEEEEEQFNEGNPNDGFVDPSHQQSMRPPQPFGSRFPPPRMPNAMSTTQPPRGAAFPVRGRGSFDGRGPMPMRFRGRMENVQFFRAPGNEQFNNEEDVENDNMGPRFGFL